MPKSAQNKVYRQRVSRREIRGHGDARGDGTPYGRINRPKTPPVGKGPTDNRMGGGGGFVGKGRPNGRSAFTDVNMTVGETDGLKKG